MPLERRKLCPQQVEVFKSKTSGRFIKQQVAKHQTACPNMRHHEEQNAGLPGLGLLVLEADQHKGSQSHDFPHHQKKDGVAGAKHQRVGQQQQVKEGGQGANILGAVIVCRVADGVDGNSHSRQRNEQDEERA